MSIEQRSGTSVSTAGGEGTGRQLCERRANREPAVPFGQRAGSGRRANSKGKVGADVTTEEAAEHARLVGLQLLAVLKAELGDLDRIRRIVKLLGMVNAVPEYTDHSKVVNGCSDLFVEVFGEKHARSSIGVGSLPFGITIEIEAVVEVE